MFKIYKCIPVSRNFPAVCLPARQMSCGEKCPPRYECKQEGPSEDEKQLQELREIEKPTIFQRSCQHNSKLWKNIFYFVCAPTILCIFINAHFMADETKRPKFIEFSYLRIRNKQFPWDPVRTLFHNPRLNALPTGYEVEVPEEEEYDPFESNK